MSTVVTIASDAFSPVGATPNGFEWVNPENAFAPATEDGLVASVPPDKDSASGAFSFPPITTDIVPDGAVLEAVRLRAKVGSGSVRLTCQRWHELNFWAGVANSYGTGYLNRTVDIAVLTLAKLREGPTAFRAMLNESDAHTVLDFVALEITYSIPAPVADFDHAVDGETIPPTVSFTDASTGLVSSWAWDFGDGETSTDQNPTHQYSSPGDYDVSLTVTGPGGSDEAAAQVTVSATVSGEPPEWETSLRPTSTPTQVVLFYRWVGMADKDLATQLGKRAMDCLTSGLRAKARLFWQASVLAHEETAMSRYFSADFARMFGTP